MAPDDPGVVRTGLSAILVVAALGGCGKPTEAVYQSAWDGQASQWEPPPSRMVGGGGGGGAGAGEGPGIGGGLSGYSACTKQDQPNCCYDDKPGHPSGSPKCTWKRLSPGESTTITAGYKDGQKVTLPVPLTLTSVSPPAYATYDECLHATLGFILSGPGMEEGHLVGNIAMYDLKTDGLWVGRGGGGEQQLVVGRDTSTTDRDGPPPSPTYTRWEGLCAPLKEPGFAASVEYFDQIDFEIDGVKYTTDFRTNPNGAVTGYYVVVQKGF
jgi:hypothetical protein